MTRQSISIQSSQTDLVATALLSVQLRLFLHQYDLRASLTLGLTSTMMLCLHVSLTIRTHLGVIRWLIALVTLTRVINPRQD